MFTSHHELNPNRSLLEENQRRPLICNNTDIAAFHILN